MDHPPSSSNVTGAPAIGPPGPTIRTEAVEPPTAASTNDQGPRRAIASPCSRTAASSTSCRRPTPSTRTSTSSPCHTAPPAAPLGCRVAPRQEVHRCRLHIGRRAVAQVGPGEVPELSRHGHRGISDVDGGQRVPDVGLDAHGERRRAVIEGDAVGAEATDPVAVDDEFSAEVRLRNPWTPLGDDSPATRRDERGEGEQGDGRSSHASLGASSSAEGKSAASVSSGDR